MQNHKIIYYQSPYGNVECYLKEGELYLSQKEMSKLLNKSVKTISRYLAKRDLTILTNEKRYAKIQIIKNKNKTFLYSVNYVIKIAEEMGDFSILDFKNWIDTNNYESNDNQYKIVRFNQDNVDINVMIDFDENTVWLTQDEIATLLGTSQQNVSNHINNIIKDEEMLEEATHKNFLLVQTEGNRTIKRNVAHYNLDMIISLGFRVNSKVAIAFRRWANKVLKQYMTKGCVVNTNHHNELFLDKLLSLDTRTEKLEFRVNKLEEQFDKSIDEMMIKDGEFFDAMSLLQELCSKAERRIIIIDPYADSKVLNILKNKRENIEVLLEISHFSKLSKDDVNTFIKQYGLITVIQNNMFHDRYLFIDEQAYHLGTSINYMANKISQIDEIHSDNIKDFILSQCK